MSGDTFTAGNFEALSRELQAAHAADDAATAVEKRRHAEALRAADAASAARKDALTRRVEEIVRASSADIASRLHAKLAPAVAKLATPNRREAAIEFTDSMLAADAETREATGRELTIPHHTLGALANDAAAKNEFALLRLGAHQDTLYGPALYRATEVADAVRARNYPKVERLLAAVEEAVAERAGQGAPGNLEDCKRRLATSISHASHGHRDAAMAELLQVEEQERKACEVAEFEAHRQRVMAIRSGELSVAPEEQEAAMRLDGGIFGAIATGARLARNLLRGKQPQPAPPDEAPAAPRSNVVQCEGQMPNWDLLAR